MKKGRSDGGYTRVFGDEELGSLISQVHATSISAGTELEKLICSSHTQVMTQQDLANLLNKKLPNGSWLIPKKLIQKHIKKNIGSNSEPDFIIIVLVDEKAYVVELKDGDSFDTKKAKGEVASCRTFAQLFGNYLLKNELFFEVSIRICCFNQTSHDEIVKGFKGAIKKSEAWTGQDLCRVLGISYSNIIQQRAVHQQQNLTYFVGELMKINLLKIHLAAI
ncbi:MULTISPECIES: type II restriction endonuclease [Ralstonia solanacearum species complex]|nr:type II restriction endonuclease [Ralstonia solanacearum]MDN4065636.1 hypothetical protein [Ralstonia solanacearum]NUU73373.1 type II restriction endonuclease [Ralstonia solanacearum]